MVLSLYHESQLVGDAAPYISIIPGGIMSSFKITHYQQPAGGWGSLRASLRSLRQEHALTDGAALLLKMNQAEGFDCPGCAWGDPEAHSSFEFCENGVKAVAAEATGKRVTADFLQRTPCPGWRSKRTIFWKSRGV